MNLSHRYSVAERAVCCDLPLPELASNPAAADREPAISIFLGAPAGEEPRSIAWRQPDSTAGEAADAEVRLGTFDGGYIVAYPEGGRFLIARAGDRIQCMNDGGLPAPLLRHMVLDRVLPLALSLRGDMVLHAGAVALGDGAVALVGASGKGKSTLTGYLGMHGAQVLTDDCLVVRRRGGDWCAVPYYRNLRLWPESLAELGLEVAADSLDADRTAKIRIGRSSSIRFRENSVPLRMLCFLGEPAQAGAPVLQPLSPREAYFAVLAESFSLEIRARAALQDQLRFTSRLAEEVPAGVLRYPRRFRSLASVGECILSALAESCDAGGLS